MFSEQIATFVPRIFNPLALLLPDRRRLVSHRTGGAQTGDKNGAGFALAQVSSRR
ncbi:hypothetical protein [Hoeflea sp.]|uniref:hypothetical protein n=1 Tax=Hoeflea sp. TaxID=1940281 RepID=UPI0019AFB1E1|nr:hypothetical protein [Hoeflea sp.]MBC7282274.1 hypothetical protein [Hoeflea sp.]